MNKQVVFQTEVLWDLKNGVYKQDTYFNDGTQATSYIPKGVVLAAREAGVTMSDSEEIQRQGDIKYYNPLENFSPLLNIAIIAIILSLLFGCSNPPPPGPPKFACGDTVYVPGFYKSCTGAVIQFYPGNRENVYKVVLDCPRIKEYIRGIYRESELSTTPSNY